MPAKMLELECPGCDELLELDAGFAGGVCRCSTCGTLMTVPENPGRQGAERVLRPSRPGGRPRRPSPPGAPGGKASKSNRGGKRNERPLEPGVASSGTVGGTGNDDQTYTTESGRTILLDAQGIPTAHKRKVARYATYGVFVVGIGLIVAACVFAVMALLQNPPTPPGRGGVVETFTYDRDANPFELEAANILGLPLRDRTVIVVDSSSSSGAWLATVKAAVTAGLVGKDSGSQVELIYGGGGKVQMLSGSLQRVSDVSAREMSTLHERVAAEGASDLTAAVDQAARLSPSHLVLIGSSRPDAAATTAIESVIASLSGVYVDTVAIGDDILAFDDLAHAHRGRYVRLSEADLQWWVTEADVAR